MNGSAEVIKAVNKIHDSVNAGFKGVYDKIDEKFNDCDEKFDECAEKVIIIEQKLAIKEALKKQTKESKKYSKDYWQYVIRVISVAGILALLSIALGIKL